MSFSNRSLLLGAIVGLLLGAVGGYMLVPQTEGTNDELLQQLHEEIGQLESQLYEADESISDLTGAVSSKEAEVLALDEELAGKMAEMEELSALLESQGGLNAVLNDTITELEAQVARLQAQISQLSAVHVVNGTRGGVITSDEVWSGEILITEHLMLQEGVKLTIEPGTVIKFKHYRGYKESGKRLSFIIRGTLEAVGTPEERIWFTSDAVDPQNGDWAMLRIINSGCDDIIKYAVVEFALQGINVWNSDPTISHSIIRWNNWEGLYLESYCKAVIEYNQIYENGYNGIAMEQYNDAVLRYNTVGRSGTNGIHIDASTATLRGNIIESNNAFGLSVDDHGTIMAVDTTLRHHELAGLTSLQGVNTIVAVNTYFENNTQNIATNPGTTSYYTTGTGAGTINYDYADLKPYDLGYIPGDKSFDQYNYIYPAVDETRQVISMIGDTLGLTWSAAWDGSHIWTATLGGEVYRLDPVTGYIDKQWTFPGPQAWGMTYDGSHLWVNDFAEKKVYEMDTNGNTVSSFTIPDTTGGAKGITWDGQYLYIMGWTTPTIYKVDKLGTLLETINIQGGHAGGGLTWDGTHFWAPGGRGIAKIARNGTIVGGIYSASEGTWDMTWDGTYLWVTQRTNENWFDDKIYQIQILDDTL